MGFIEIAAVNRSEELSGIWSEFYDISKVGSSGRITALPEKITDGMRIFLKNGQSFIMVSDNKISDYIAGAGAFVFHSAFEPYKYTGKSSGRYNELYAEYPDMFGSHSENAVCYLVNTDEKIKLLFEFSEAAYYDKNYGFDIFLQGSGYFEIGVSDALACFVKLDFDSENFEQKDFLNISEDGKNKLAAAFENMLKSALSGMRELDIGYDKLMYSTDKIVSLINSDPKSARYLPSGIEITDVEFTSICPGEKSIMEIVSFRREKKG